MSQTPALSKLERVAAEIEDAKKELDETKAKMKAAEAAGESARYLALEQREIAIRQNLAALRVKENRLESADSGPLLKEIKEIAFSLKEMRSFVKKLVHSELERSRPYPQSTRTERVLHQHEFKAKLRRKYLADGVDRCMVTQAPVKPLIASHIIGLNQREILSKVDLRPEDLWDVRNGLLVCEAIENAYTHMEIAYLLNPKTQVFHMWVLYDDVLERSLDIPRSECGLEGDGMATFRDIQGWVVRFPTLVFPFRRAMFFMAWYYFDTALNSPRPTAQTAEKFCPDVEQWEEIRAASTVNSDCGDSLFLFEFGGSSVPASSSAAVSTTGRSSDVADFEAKMLQRKQRFSTPGGSKRRAESGELEGEPVRKKLAD